MPFCRSTALLGVLLEEDGILKLARLLLLSVFLIVLGIIGAPGRVNANWISGVSVVDGEADDLIFFPNWVRAYAAAFQPTDSGSDCGTTGCAVCNPKAGAQADNCGGTGVQVSGLTITNFGTAVAITDITGVYWLSDCTLAGGGLTWHTMTNIAPQMWTWAWNGVEANPSMLDTKTLVVGQIKVYVDIAEIPTDGATVQMGIPYDPIGGYMGGLMDRCCGTASWSDTTNPMVKTIKYVAKFVDKIEAAPGDTLNYTVYYGKPGLVGSNIQNLEIIDTQPGYTHYNGISSDVPDPGWEPNWGPPPKLKWTLWKTATLVNGGATKALTFQMTVDWGNGESFEPGSGDIAAPENFSLRNNATGIFPNLAAGTQAHKSNNTRTTVRRFLFWKIGDRDVLYSNTPSSIDEITYSIFIKNMSLTKTWWSVSLWDTVPVQVNPWADGCGVEDSCVGWTMTPTGCAVAGSGRIVAGGQTIITWRLDMAPSMTLNLRWKAKVAANAINGQTCINKVSVLEYGRTNIIDGTGHSTTPKNFTHKARIILHTTYVSYVAMNSDSGGVDYYISLYPLHPSSAFQLFRFAEAACVEGVRPSISNPAPALPCNSWPGAGCPVGIERRPQRWGPDASTYNYFKLVSNAPLLWEVQPIVSSTAEDSHMYCTTTNLSFRGNTIYTYRRMLDLGTLANESDYFGIANSEDMITTIHMFQWEPGSLDWGYRQSRTIDPLSQWMTGGTPAALDGHWKIISSDSDLFVWKGYTFSQSDADNYCTMAPEMDGNLVGAAAGDEFWVYAGKWMGGSTDFAAITLINMGVANATYKIYKYNSLEMFDVAGATPGNLGGASGEWSPFLNGTIPFGQGGGPPWNPVYYSMKSPSTTPPGCIDNSDFTETFQLIRVVLTSNGVPIQIRAGPGNARVYGGFTLHGIDAARNPAKTPWEWWENALGADGNGTSSYVSFCSAKGMAVQITTENGFSATYATTAPDQPVVHCPIVSPTEIPVASCGTNYIFKLVAPTPAGKSMIANICGRDMTERGFAAPFLSTGTHYEITAPAVVFSGQSFWITVAVIDFGGGTKTDYTGITSFSSTDPKAMMQGSNMDAYNFTWTGCPGTCGVKLFFQVTLTQLGLINLTGQDILDGSITGMTTIMVVGADVKIEKRNKLTVAASGDTVRFQICWSNYSSATGYSFTITDAIPRGTTYWPEDPANAICGQNGPATASVTMAAGGASGTTPPAAMTTYNPGTPPPSTSRWLRWTISHAYVAATGCICFKVLVN